MKSVNSWLFKDPIPTLVDCGEYTADSWDTLKMQLKTHGLEIKDIQKIVVTHAHVDHMGMANQVVQESGATVYLSEYAFPWGEHVNELWASRSQIIKETFLKLVGPESPIHGMFSTGQSFFDSMLAMWEPIPKDHVVKFESKDGIDIGGRHWEVIYAPGHSSTQTVFFDRDSRHLLSADMLLNIAPTPVIEIDPLQPGTRQPGLPKLIESFGNMKALNISKAFPGHYDAFEDVNETIDRQLKRIEMRTQHCYTLIKQGSHDYNSLFLNMYPNRMHFPALVMMIGYLDVLEDRGLISKEKDEQGIFRFEAKLKTG